MKKNVIVFALLYFFVNIIYICIVLHRFSILNPVLQFKLSYSLQFILTIQ